MIEQNLYSDPSSTYINPDFLEGCHNAASFFDEFPDSYEMGPPELNSHEMDQKENDGTPDSTTVQENDGTARGSSFFNKLMVALDNGIIQYLPGDECGVSVPDKELVQEFFRIEYSSVVRQLNLRGFEKTRCPGHLIYKHATFCKNNTKLPIFKRIQKTCKCSTYRTLRRTETISNKKYSDLKAEVRKLKAKINDLFRDLETKFY